MLLNLLNHTIVQYSVVKYAKFQKQFFKKPWAWANFSIHFHFTKNVKQFMNNGRQSKATPCWAQLNFVVEQKPTDVFTFAGFAAEKFK